MLSLRETYFLLWRQFVVIIFFALVQFAKENPHEMDYSIIRIQDDENVTEAALETVLRKAISRISTLQAHDGHWPGDYGGPMFLLPGLVYS